MIEEKLWFDVFIHVYSRPILYRPKTYATAWLASWSINLFLILVLSILFYQLIVSISITGIYTPVSCLALPIRPQVFHCVPCCLDPFYCIHLP